MNRVIIFGIGEYCDKFLLYADKEKYELVGYIDNYKKGTCYKGQKVYGIEKVKELEFDEIIITPYSKRQEITEQLINVGCPYEKIVGLDYANTHYMVDFSKVKDIVFINDVASLFNIVYADATMEKDVTMWRFYSTTEKWIFPDLCHEKEIVFFVLSHCYTQFKKSGLFDFLYGAFPKAKYVLVLSDIIDGEYGYNNRTSTTGFLIDEVKEKFDLISTYHPFDAKKYGLECHFQPYSIIDEDEVELEYDVFFVGNAKNRLDTILTIYNSLKNNNVKCEFWINEVPKDRIKELDCQIHVNTFLPYETYIKKMKKSRCILEICQKGDVSTLRYVEALSYNKKLITTDKYSINYPLYNERFIKVLDDFESLDLEWILNAVEPKYEKIDAYSNRLFIDNIKRKLNSKIVK